MPERPMRLAYADPPYPGQSKKHYGGHPLRATMPEPCEMCENGEPCIHCLGDERDRYRRALEGIARGEHGAVQIALDALERR